MTDFTKTNICIIGAGSGGLTIAADAGIVGQHVGTAHFGLEQFE